jgi:hypothetical protein
MDNTVRSLEQRRKLYHIQPSTSNLPSLMTMPVFHMTLRVGHLNNLNSTIRYLLMMKHATIRVRIEEHHFSDLPDNIDNWTYSVHSKVERGANTIRSPCAT